jgi:hypothetical protein
MPTHLIRQRVMEQLSEKPCIRTIQLVRTLVMISLIVLETSDGGFCHLSIVLS